jgi:hypothetical protein
MPSTVSYGPVCFPLARQYYHASSIFINWLPLERNSLEHDRRSTTYPLLNRLAPSNANGDIQPIGDRVYAGLQLSPTSSIKSRSVHGDRVQQPSLTRSAPLQPCKY